MTVMSHEDPALPEAEIDECEAVIACLGDDAALLRRDNPYCEIAANMEAAATLLQKVLADFNKSERRAIVFGDIVHNQVLAMQAAVIDGHLKTPAHGLQWIVNTLMGPGHLPDLNAASAIGGAQAWFNRETAEHEKFRAAHPGPASNSKENR